MSVAGQARHVRGSMELLYDTRKENNILHALIRDQSRKPGTVSSRPIGSIDSSPTFTNTNVFTEPIAFHPKPFIITSDEADTLRIDKNFGAYSSRVIVTGFGGTDDDISTIVGLDDGEGNTGKAAFAGQLLLIDAALSGDLTLKEGTTWSLPGAADFIIPAGQNVLTVYDSTSDRWQILGSGNASLWSRFPAVTNVDMKGFNILNIGNLIFDDVVGGFAVATNPTIYYDLANTELVIQTQSNTEEIVLAAGSAAADKFARMDKTLSEFNLVAGHEMRLNALHVFEISQFDGEMVLDVPTPTMAGNPNFKINAVVTDANFGGDLGTATLPWNNLNVEQIRLRAGDVIIDIPSITRIGNNMVLNVNTSAQFDWRELNSDIMRLNATALALIGIKLNMNGNNIDDIGVSTHDNVIFNDVVGGFAVATNPTIYYDLSNTELVIQSNAGEQIALRIGTAIGGLFARLDENLQDFSLVAGSEFRTQALHAFDVFQADGEMTLDVPTPTMTGNPNFSLNAVVTDANFGGDLGKSTLPWNNLNVETIRLREGDEIIDIASIAFRADKLRINAATGNTIVHMFNGVINYEWDVDKLDINDNFIQFDARAVPTPDPPATELFLFSDSGNSDHLSIRRAGSTVDLEAAGAGGNEIIQGDTRVTITDTGTGQIESVVDGTILRLETLSAGTQFDNRELEFLGNMFTRLNNSNAFEIARVESWVSGQGVATRNVLNINGGAQSQGLLISISGHNDEWYLFEDEIFYLGTDASGATDGHGLALFNTFPSNFDLTDVPSGWSVVFRDQADNELKVKKNIGGVFSTVSLEAGGGGGANVNLSNLASPTAINQDLRPGTTNIDVGIASDRFKEMNCEDLDTESTFKHASGESAANQIGFFGGALVNHVSVSRVVVGEALSATQSKVQALQDALNSYNLVST